jgi:hypothetical protein
MKSAHKTLRGALRALVVAILGGATVSVTLAAGAGTHGNQSLSTLASGRVDQRGRMRAIYHVASRRFPGTPEEAARAFLQEKRSLLKTEAETSTLKADRVLRVPGGSHVRFVQQYRGIPVYHGDVVVSLNANNEIGMITTNARDDITPNTTTPLFGPERAISLTRTLLKAHGNSLTNSERAELNVYRDDALGMDRLVYRVTMALENPAGDWEVLLDATTGNEIRREDRFVNHSTDVTNVNGTGYVYTSNPVSVARQTYGAPGYIDNEDADTDQLTAGRTLVTLDSLTFEDGLYKLTGPACTITDIESPFDSVAWVEQTPDGFRYTRSQPGFEAVMAYYHVTAAYRRFVELGFSCPSLRSLPVDPHGFQGKDNSHYSPGGNWISFGTGGVDDAEDADVIWHEYGHAIQYNIIPTWGGGECGALGEGFGDYWAGSHSRGLNQWSPTDQQYSWLFLWDGHNDYWQGRILNDPHKYPFGTLSVHMAGQIWSSALMEIQGDLGRDVTDRLVLKSLYYLTGEITAVDNAQAILQADRDLYGGIHLPTLMYWLCTVKGFIPISGDNGVLVLNDELPNVSDTVIASQKGTETISPSQKTMTSLLPLISLAGELCISTSTFSNFDTSALTTTNLLVLLGGINPHPFDNPAKRHAIVEYVRRGGKVLVEGGEVGYYYRRDGTMPEIDSAFRVTVLHARSFVDDGASTSLVCNEPQRGLFSHPHQVSGPVTFETRSAFGDRDIMTPETEDASTRSIGQWSDPGQSPAIIAHFDSAGKVQTLYLPFSLASIADSSISMELTENALSYILYYQSNATDVASRLEQIAGKITLHQNYPNPFNPTTTIAFDLPSRSRVRLAVFTVLGQEVSTIVNGDLGAGPHFYHWDATKAGGMSLSSGMYIFRLEVDSGTQRFVQSRTMLLIR